MMSAKVKIVVRSRCLHGAGCDVYCDYVRRGTDHKPQNVPNKAQWGNTLGAADREMKQMWCDEDLISTESLYTLHLTRLPEWHNIAC